MAVIIYPYRVLKETPKALLISWHDYNRRQRVKAWVPKSQAVREGHNIQLTKLCYQSLKTINMEQGKTPPKRFALLTNLTRKRMDTLATIECLNKELKEAKEELEDLDTQISKITNELKELGYSGKIESL